MYLGTCFFFFNLLACLMSMSSHSLFFVSVTVLTKLWHGLLASLSLHLAPDSGKTNPVPTSNPYFDLCITFIALTPPTPTAHPLPLSFRPFFATQESHFREAEVAKVIRLGPFCPRKGSSLRPAIRPSVRLSASPFVDNNPHSFAH